MIRKTLLALLTIALAWIGLLFKEDAIQHTEAYRAFERLPFSALGAMEPGRVLVEGRAVALPDVVPLTGPRTGTTTLFFRYTIEREERDSDGNRTWRIIHDESRHVPFALQDETGAADVDLAGVRPELDRHHQSISGSRRYTEYLIRDGDPVRLLAMAEDRAAPERMRLHFPQDMVPGPRISDKPIDRLIMGDASVSIGMTWFGLTLLGLSVLTLFAMGRWHHPIVYLLLLTLVSTSVILHHGLSLMRGDLIASHELARGELERWANAEVTPLEASGKSHGPARSLLTPEERHDFDAYQVGQLAWRTQATQRRFPERWIARHARLGPLPMDILPDAILEELAKDEASVVEFRVRTFWPWIWMLVGLIGGLIATPFALRFSKRSRLIDDLPTTPVAGVSWGLSEVKGIAEPLHPDDPCLTGPLSSARCTYFHYRITERRGSGKNAKTVTILDETRTTPFLLRDDSGALLVYPDGATVHSTHKVRRTQGRRTYHELSLRPGDALYALGPVRVDTERPDRLCMREDDEEEHYVLANKSEDEVLYLYARRALIITQVALISFTLATLFFLARFSGIGPADQMGAAFVTPAFLLLSSLVLYYNDLVFLRERAARAHSNIDVSLKKRWDLLQQVLPVVRATVEHERDVQELVGAMRSEPTGGQALAMTSGRLLALREAWPTLRADETFGKLFATITNLENEIALMRAGYNDAVEHYHRRLERIPEAWIARLGDFPRLPWLQWDERIAAVPAATTRAQRAPVRVTQRVSALEEGDPDAPLPEPSESPDTPASPPAP